MLDIPLRGFFFRFIVSILGLSLIAMGVRALLLRHDTFYTNWFGGLVYAEYSGAMPVSLLLVLLNGRPDRGLKRFFQGA